LQTTRLDPFGHGSPADPDFIGDIPNRFANSVEVLGPAEHILSRVTLRLPGGMTLVPLDGRKKRAAGKSADVAHLPLDGFP
jgi:hypothetical protein